MRLRKNASPVDFLKRVQKCQYDVYLETEEEDRLNLKSVLSQYLFVVLAEQSDVWEHSRITCKDTDREVLKEYLDEI